MRERAMRWIAAIAEAPAAPAVALLCGLALLFKPAQVFEGNSPYFFFGVMQNALVLVPLFLVSSAALLWLATRGGPRAQRVAAAVLGGLAIAAWVNSTFVSTTGGILDGRTLLRMADAQQARYNALLWASIAIGAGGLAYARMRIARRFLAALFAVLAAHSAWIAIADTHPWRDEPQSARLASFSAEKNVLVIILDTFQSDFFPPILERDPALRAAFEGFTYFSNAVSASPTTYLALPAIHAGASYREGQSLRKLYLDNVVHGSFMAKLAGSGYDAMLVNPIFNDCPQGVRCEHEGPLIEGQARFLVQQALYLVDVSLFRMAPDALKGAIYDEGEWFLSDLLLSDRVIVGNGIIDYIAQGVRKDSARPAVRFLHLFSTHPPSRVDAKCERVPERPWTREPAIEQDQCAISKLAGLLAALRTHDLYDRTAILVMADHGAGFSKSDWPWGEYASPLMLAKPFGAHGALATSERVVGIADTGATVCAWTGACRADSGTDMTSAAAPAAPSYPFTAYRWRHEYWFGDSVPIEDRFEIRGPPRDIASWWRLTHTPTQSIELLHFAESDQREAYGFGWSGFEKYQDRDWRWAVGSEAGLYLKLEPSHDAHIALDIATHAANQGQRMSLEVNGIPVAEVPVSVAGDHVEIVIPRQVLKAEASRLLFRFAKSNPPGTSDERPLAVAFETLRVR